MANYKDIHNSNPTLTVLILMVLMTTASAVDELTISIIWDSREFANSSAIMDALDGMTSYFDLHEVTFHSAYIDLATVEPMKLRDSVCEHVVSGSVAFLYVYSCFRFSAVELAFQDTNVPLRSLRVACTEESQQLDTAYADYFPASSPEVGKVVNEAIASKGWETTIIVYETEKLETVDEIMYYSELSNSTVRTLEMMGGDLEDVLYTLTVLQHQLTYPRTAVLVLNPSTITAMLDAMNEYNTVNDVQAVFVYGDQWMIVTESSMIPTIQNHIDQIDNVAAIVPGDIENMPVITMIKDTYADMLETTQLSFCSSANITDGGEDGNCESPYNPTFLSGLSVELLIAEAILPCDTCSDFLVYTNWRQEYGPELSVVAHWQDDSGLMSSGMQPLDVLPNTEFGFNHRNLLIGSMEWSPFMSFAENSTSDNIMFEGLCDELIRELANTLNFTYTMTLPIDGEWGVQIAGTHQWTGLVGSLQNKTMDITVAPMTISVFREQAMDFSVAYFQEYSTVLSKLVDPDDSKWRLYLSPFRWTVWLCIAASVPITAAIIYIFNRTSPFYTKEEACKGLGMWDQAIINTFGSIFTQGMVFLPEAQSGRFLVGFWWIYCVVVGATYSGNLIAFLTVSESKLYYDTLQEMIDYGGGTYGTLSGTATVTAMEDTTQGELIEIWDNIKKFNESNPAVLSYNHTEHIEMVKKGGYGYIGDQTGFDVALSQNCDLDVIEERFFPSSYGVGMQNNSQYQEAISGAVTKTIESGLINRWKQQWWPRQSFCSRGMVTVAEAVTLKDVQGAYYALGILILAAALVLAIEGGIRCYRRKRPHRTDLPVSHQNGHIRNPQEDRYRTEFIKTEFSSINNGAVASNGAVTSKGTKDETTDYYKRRNSRYHRRESDGKAMDMFGRELRDGIKYDVYGHAVGK